MLHPAPDGDVIEKTLVETTLVDPANAAETTLLEAANLHAPDTPVLTAEGISLSAERGPVYGPVTLSIGEGLTIIVSEEGTGKTSLMLTLAGRMKADEGRLFIGDSAIPARPRDLQRVSQIAGFDDIDLLDDSVSVAKVIRERLSYVLPWWTILPSPANIDLETVCGPVFGDVPHPAGDDLVRDLTEEQRMLLRVALAGLSSPRFIAIDDISQVRSARARQEVLRALEGYSQTGVAVICASASQDDVLYEHLDSLPTLLHLSEVTHS